MNRTQLITIGVAALASAGIALAAFGGGGHASATPTVTSAPTTTSPTPSEQPGALADGEHTGWIVAAYVAPDELVFDPADLLVGDEAAAAAEAAGQERLDFFVRDHPDARTSVPVVGDVRVTTVDCESGCVEGAPSDYGTLTFTADGRTLYRVTIEDGWAVQIDAIYLP